MIEMLTIESARNSFHYTKSQISVITRDLLYELHIMNNAAGFSIHMNLSIRTCKKQNCNFHKESSDNCHISDYLSFKQRNMLKIFLKLELFLIFLSSIKTLKMLYLISEIPLTRILVPILVALIKYLEVFSLEGFPGAQEDVPS